MFELIDMIIVRPITNVLFVIYGLVGDFGLAIILFTVLVKILLWPLVKRQLHQTRLMKKIQPELAEIKKNCNGNRQLESLQMMDLYKRNNIKPFRSIITLVIQLPIFIALYTAVRVMVLPTTSDNLSIRAYMPVRQLEGVEEVISKQDAYFAEIESYKQAKDERQSDLAEPAYTFEPKLFGLVNLAAKPGFKSWSALAALTFAICSALMQYYVSRQQMPSNKSEKSRTFRQLMKEAADGKEPDQAELSQVMTSQMSMMMPIMMFLIMINLPGALVFYYGISNVLTILQQRIILKMDAREMEVAADKKIIKELKNIEEGQVVETSGNKHTKTTKEKSSAKITRISAKSSRKGHKKKRS